MASDKKTVVERSTFNNHPTLSIWEADQAGNKIGKAPIVSFGITKAKELWDYRGEIKKFLEENGCKTE